MGRRLTYPLCFFLWFAVLSAGAARAADATLVGYWMLDEQSGLIAADSSGNGNDGTLSGDLTWQPAAGKWVGALLWGGTNTAHVEVSAAGLSASAGTIMMWGNLSEPQPSQTRYFFGHTTQPSYNNRIQLYMDGSNTELDLGLGGAHVVRSNIRILETQRWYHVALTWNNGSYVVYIDGEEAAAGSYSGLSAIHDFLWIGNDGNPVSEGTEAFGGLLDEVAIYSRALPLAEVQYVMNGGLREKATATEPQPEDGAVDVRRDVVLAWVAGKYAAAHDVYFGTVQASVEAADRANPMGVLVSQGQSDASYAPAGLLEIGQTYYWRIDEVNAAPDNSIYKGDVWSFTAEPMAYPIASVTATSNATPVEGQVPDNAVNGSGLDADGLHSTQANDMWLGAPGEDPVWIQFEFDKVYKLHELLVWNYNVMFEPVLGFGLKDVTIEHSLDGAEWVVLGDAQFARATAKAGYAHNTTVGLGGAVAKYVRFNVKSGWGMMGQYGLSEVRFTYIPVRARQPQPADGATNVDPDTILSWRAGREAASHDVYVGTDSDTLSLVDNVTQTSAMSAAVEFGTTYYWRVDEVGDTVWVGDLWTFSTSEYALIDGFEDYTDDIDAGEAIFDTWVDGWVNKTGSTVGYLEAPFAERTIVRTGKQSMPLQYDNSKSPFYSEATRTFDVAQNWTVHGANTLVLYFRGVPGPFLELADGKIIMGAAGTDIWNTADEFRFAYKPLSGNGSIVALIESVSRAVDWTKAGVMIRETLEAGSAFAAVYATPDYGCRYQARLTTGAAAVSDSGVVTAEQTALRPPYWVKIERVGSSFNGYYSTDGANWTAMAWNPQTIAMGANVYIGLAVTSHSAGVLASAEFSGVATTGNVNGGWLVETIGAAQPAGNGAGQLYVTLEDASGKTATVSHPAGAGAVFLAGWNEWAIPYSALAGVNLSRIEAMTIGVGNRTSPAAGGTGIVYIDDIGYGKPASE
ncbi:MAG TPA: discoidin domain-containing protein [Sedimentisphaerales bacterium]|nr:discoidin domain-containing protein [Sedimentisphaerales bacterium]HRS10784.1 discoidin domain-containing protein [Sedimentisphaerales bacterium]HRV47490.1 discoidin domain-containing protein [Sedimentisphaerales bacterium]